jgi:plasmid stability protein
MPARRYFSSHLQHKSPVVYARVSRDEHRMLTLRAAERGQTMSAFVRDCINAWLFAENEDGQLLEHYDNDKGVASEVR